MLAQLEYDNYKFCITAHVYVYLDYDFNKKQMYLEIINNNDIIIIVSSFNSYLLIYFLFCMGAHT